MQREDRSTISLIHSLDDTEYLGGDSPLSLTINPMHHIHFLFRLSRLFLCLINISVMHRVLLIVHIIVGILDLLIDNIHRSGFLVMKGPIFLREDLQADLVATQTTILVFKAQDKQVISETINLHSGFVGVVTSDIESPLEEFALSDTQNHFLETKMIFIERSTFRKIKFFFIF